MGEQVRGLSSMATKELLAELSDAARRERSLSVSFDSAGGVDVARSIRAGADADLAVLSGEAMVDLDADGLLGPGTLRALFVSDVVAAVPDNAGLVALSTEDDLRQALITAGRIAYSTGPSGEALVNLLERWQLADVVADRLAQVTPGTSVGSVLAAGDADLGFQQRTEFAGIAGVRLLGALPGEAAIRSTFSGAVLAQSSNAQAAREVLEYFASKEAEHYVLTAGMVMA